MTLSEEILKQIKDMSAALLPPAEIAILLDISSPIYTSYHQGRLQTKLNLRKTVIKLAVAGSPAAEPLADKYMKEQSINE